MIYYDIIRPHQHIQMWQKYNRFWPVTPANFTICILFHWVEHLSSRKPLGKMPLHRVAQQLSHHIPPIWVSSIRKRSSQMVPEVRVIPEAELEVGVSKSTMTGPCQTLPNHSQTHLRDEWWRMAKSGDFCRLLRYRTQGAPNNLSDWSLLIYHNLPISTRFYPFHELVLMLQGTQGREEKGKPLTDHGMKRVKVHWRVWILLLGQDHSGRGDPPCMWAFYVDCLWLVPALENSNYQKFPEAVEGVEFPMSLWSDPEWIQTPCN